MSNRSLILLCLACLACLLTAPLTAGAAILSTTTGTYSGGDVGDGLDLYQPTSQYLYALDLGKTSAGNLTVGNVTFNPVDVVTPSAPTGVTVTGTSLSNLPTYGDGGFFTYAFGATANDDNLELISKSNGQGGPLTLTLSLGALPTGSQYQLQLLFIDDFLAGTRLTNIVVDGTAVVTGLNQRSTINAAGGYTPASPTSYPYTLTKGAVVTVVGTSTGPSLTVTVANGGGNAPLLAALTLVPEPASAGLLGIGALLVLARRR